jgi:tetratricopeptide (TPR) repeat protein
MARPQELSRKDAAEACLATARELDRNGYDREAAAQYIRARELGVTEPEIAWRLAVLSDRLGDSVQAKKEYDLACRHLPRNADLWNDRGCSDLNQQEYPAAEKAFRLALAIQPKHDRASMNLGLALAAQERYEEAVDCFAAVVGPAAAQSNLGMILARQGRHEAAEAAFERSLAEDSSLRQPQAALAVLRDRNSVSPARFE